VEGGWKLRRGRKTRNFFTNGDLPEEREVDAVVEGRLP